MGTVRDAVIVAAGVGHQNAANERIHTEGIATVGGYARFASSDF